MGLLKCPDCQRDISDSAPTCIHCGRIMQLASQQVAPPKRRGCAAQLGIAVAVIVGILVVLMVLANIGGPPVKQLDVEVEVRRMSVTVINEAAHDSIGQKMDVYLNDRPPFTYVASGTLPAIGGKVTIPLSEFTKDDKRFNPFLMAVTEVWVVAPTYNARGFIFKH